jgi:hypothetical protein
MVKHAVQDLEWNIRRVPQAFSAKASSINIGDPFGKGTDQGPQVSQIQYDVSNLFIFNFFPTENYSIAYYGVHRVWEEGGRNAPPRR